MAVDYLDALQKFRDGGGTDINKFLSQHTTPSTPPLPTLPVSTPPASIAGAAPVAPPPIASDTVTPAPAAAATSAAAVAPPPPAPVAPPVTTPPAPPIEPGINVLRQVLRTQEPALNNLGGGVTALPRNPINSRNLYPPEADQARMLGGVQSQPATPAALAQFDRQFGFGPGKSATGTVDESTGSFGSGWKPQVSAPAVATPAAVPTANVSPRLAAATESDSPPGTEGTYSQGPLANPKPSPKPTGLTALPRSRNQRMASNVTPRVFARAA